MNAHVLWALPYLKYVRCWVNLGASLHQDNGIELMGRSGLVSPGTKGR